MSSNNTESTDESTPTTATPIHPSEITLNQLQRPGVLFEAGECLFLTAGGFGYDGLNVFRLDTLERDQLDEALLEEDIENEEVELLSLHSKHSEVPVNRVVLATLLDYAATDIEEFPERVPGDVEEAVEIARETLTEGN